MRAKALSWPVNGIGRIYNELSPHPPLFSKRGGAEGGGEFVKQLGTLNWYAVYTLPRAEKKAYSELLGKGIETYLPLQRTLRKWSDRKKWVEEPLFRSYIFVHIPPSFYFDVLNTPGIVRYVTFESKAVPIPPLQIEAVRFFLSSDDLQPENPEQYIPGRPIEVIKGPLKGLSGELLQLAGRQKVKVEISAVGQSIFVTIPMSHLRIISL
jgi:transcription antitermination factor NusG